MSTPERRNFFRIDQDIIFEYRPVDVHFVENNEAEAAFESDPSMTLLAELRKIDKEAQKTLKVLSEKQRLLSDYLQRLNKKVDLIARHSMFNMGKDQQAQRLNLSEGGLAFESNRALYKGNFLVLRLIFLPSYTPVIVFARVTRCDNVENRHKVAAKFHQLSDNDRQVIARQILKAQVAQRKQVNAPSKG